MGVQFATPDKRDSIVAVARNTERVAEVELDSVLGDDEPEADAAVDTDAETDVTNVAENAPHGATEAGNVTSDRNEDDDAGGSE
jgi:DNA gyrase subunit A